ncbi:MAG TPA: aldehyde dehydrogenase (NADP(+)) [Saprospiraceae bacterium]|nr:aldehyde dehydrogenase (NADP(+)) [Saprospiraceae bacterium]
MITQNIIGFDLHGSSGKKVYSFNPTTMQNIDPGFDVATQAEVDLAMDKAIRAWRIFRNIPGSQKAIFLRAIADGLENLGEPLLETINAETAYPKARILTEFNRTCAQLRMFAELTSSDDWKEITINEALPNRSPAPRPELRRVLMPIGPVVVFGASNFPLAYSTMGGDAVSALAVGCPVIIKAHESHLCTNALVAEVVMKAAAATGMPDGVFSSLNGDGIETGKQLVLHPNTAAVGFTGSLKGGKALFDLGATREKPIPVFAEMGSVNPVFILPAILKEDRKNLVDRLVSSMTMTAGQFCTKPGLIVIQSSDETHLFLEELKQALEKTASVALLNKSIAGNFYRGIEEIKKDTSVDVLQNENKEGQMASPVLATVHADHFISNNQLHQEIFGPYSLVVVGQNSKEFLRIAEIIEGQLTASVFFTPSEANQVRPLMEVLVEKAGRIICNGVPTGVEVSSAMTHGGPFPASTDYRFTAVGHYSIRRWLRPVTFQNADHAILPVSFR